MRRLIGSVILVICPATVAAQRLSFSPEIGLYVPTEKLTQLSSGSSDFSELEAGFAFGARIGMWFSKRLGVEVSGAYVPSTYKLSSNNTITEQKAKLFLGSGQVVLFLLPRTSFFTVFLNGGVGVISHGGVAFTGASDKNDVSGVFGAGAAIQLGGLALSAGAELFNYSSTPPSTQTGEAQKQRDIHFKFGFGIPFGGR